MAFAPATLHSVALATLGLLAFIAALFVGSLVLPGPARTGPRKPDGSAVRYVFNGMALFAMSLAAAALVQWLGPGLAPVARYYGSLVVAANLLAWPSALVLLLVGRADRPKRLRDFFLGVEQDPALFGVDLKLFSYRPSLIGLCLMNFSFAALQWQERGSLTLAMLLYQAGTLLYIANYFHFERGMLFTWDIMAERFGWLLLWGDYVLVPFFYCVPALYVYRRPDPLPAGAAVALVVAFALGFWLFRGANAQKHRFKETPQAPIWGRAPRTIGGRLLISGFWGIGRKLNYTGELTVYVAWTLLCGFHSLVPYAVPAWLAGLLIQRAARDDRRCRAKYGAWWEAYCRHARFRMFPYLY